MSRLASQWQSKSHQLVSRAPLLSSPKRKNNENIYIINHRTALIDYPLEERPRKGGSLNPFLMSGPLIMSGALAPAPAPAKLAAITVICRNCSPDNGTRVDLDWSLEAGSHFHKRCSAPARPSAAAVAYVMIDNQVMELRRSKGFALNGWLGRLMQYIDIYHLASEWLSGPKRYPVIVN